MLCCFGGVQCLRELILQHNGAGGDHWHCKAVTENDLSVIGLFLSCGKLTAFLTSSSMFIIPLQFR